jgi:molecular chaperone DnaK
MSSMINFGIDLGTSNSLIAKFDKGEVIVFKNPSGFKETLPSIVGYRNNRTLIGEQARSYLERDAKSVVSRFKRKMGTSESFNIKALGTAKTPVELSSVLLKDLKTFVQTGEEVDSAVITIPASFDTLQSNATKEAGKAAGFKNIVLLQEPIAASLAYANKEKNIDLRNSQWLVYDLGGGTFDAALVKIVEGELTVVDHEGDNFLGGTDFDALIVEKLIVPQMESQGTFENFLSELKSQSGKYNQLWYILVNAAEAAKVELSAKTSSEIDLGAFRVEDDNGDAVDLSITITRSDFEGVIREAVESTIEMVKKILTRNGLQGTDLKFVLMVGGSTYIPFVRKRVQEVIGIPVNTSIDPTNAIAVGAAYFAGTKEKTEVTQSSSKVASSIKVKTAYNKTSQESEESFMARVEGATPGMQYRIVSEDGSFDSGLKTLGSRIVEDLPLRPGAYNIFTLKIFDSSGSAIAFDGDVIQIAQGRYNVAGQMLPEDISLVVDDPVSGDTRLVQVFGKNVVLPAKRGNFVREVSRTIVKGSAESLKVILVEGPSNRHSSTNKPLGMIEITGKQISRDLIKGTEVEFTFTMSDSRDFSVSAYLTCTDQQFSQVFTPTTLDVSTAVLSREILELETRVQTEIEDADENGRRDVSAGLNRVLSGLHGVMGEVAALSTDDVTDKKYQLEGKKRELAREFFELIADKRLEAARREYQEARDSATAAVADSGNDRERTKVKDILARESTFISSSALERIQAETEALKQIEYGILFRTPDFLKGMFSHLNEKRASMNDQIQATQLFDSGKRAITREDWDELRTINSRLWDLLPARVQASDEMKVFTGMV